MIGTDESSYKLLDEYRIFVDRLLIDGKVSVDQLPDEIRLSSRIRHIYILVFRGLRNNDSVDEYVQTLIQLDRDIDTLRSSKSNEFVSNLEDFLIGSMAEMINKYSGITVFNEFMATQKSKRPLLFNAYLTSLDLES